VVVEELLEGGVVGGILLDSAEKSRVNTCLGTMLFSSSVKSMTHIFPSPQSIIPTMPGSIDIHLDDVLNAGTEPDCSSGHHRSNNELA
jgi:hypothetical protein